MNKFFIFFSLLLVFGLGFSDSMSLNASIVNASNLTVNLPYANISVYNTSFQNGPSYTLLNSTIADENGTFILNFDYGQADILKFEIFLNGSDKIIAGSPPITVPAQELSSTFSTLNNLNLDIGLVEAGTIFLNATNSSGEPTNFSYMVMDGNSELISSGDNIENATINLVANQNYTLNYYYFPATGQGTLPQNDIIYSTNLTDDLTTIGGQRVFVKELNLTQNNIGVTGYINATGNTSAVNISRVVFYPTTNNEAYTGPNSGIVDLISAMGPYASSAGYGYNTTTNNYSTAVPGSAVGVDYLMAVFGKDETGETGGYDNYGAFQMVTAYESAIAINFTLRPLIGADIRQSATFSGGEINSSKLSITFVNSSGDMVNPGGMIKINVSDYNETSSFNYLINVEANTSGYFILPIANNTNFTYEVFAGGYAPKKGQFNSLTTSNSSLNITLTQMEMSTPDGETMLPEIYFYPQNDLTTGASCDIPDPSVNCIYLTRMDMSEQSSFSPFAFTLTGFNPNVLIYVNSVYVYLINVDLLASGPPNAEFDGSSTDVISGSSMEQARRVGSFAPKVYNHAYVGFGLDSRADMAQPVNALFTELYGAYSDSWSPVWNNTAGSGDENASSIPAYYEDYYDTNLLLNRTAGGFPCNSTNMSKTCYLDTTDKIMWVKIPHFSGGKLEASLTYTSSSSTSTSSSKSKGTIDLTYEFNCSNGNMLVYAKEKGEDLSDVEVILLGTSTYYSDTQTTNSDGIAEYSIAKDGEYKLIATKDNYFSQSVVGISINLCTLVETAPIIEETEESSIVTEESEVSVVAQEEQEVISEEETKLSAEIAIESALLQIDVADKQGKITADAKKILEDAKLAFQNADYLSAKELAVYSVSLITEPKAKQEIDTEQSTTTIDDKKTQDNTLWYAIGAIIIIVVLAGLYYFLKGKGSGNHKDYKK